MFYRTDEAAPGRIVEIQCPGSLWGDWQLAWNFFQQQGIRQQLPSVSVAERFVADVLSSVGTHPPYVHHLLDNASGPPGMRYFIACTRGPIKYFGLDEGVLQRDCTLIRTHSFFGLMAEDFAIPRLKQRAVGRILYDLPPVVLFDQKISLALPFLDETKGFYDDHARSVIVHNYPVSKDGFRVETGEWTSLEDFARRPRSGRNYFLKYAGCDVSINWGSRAVYNMANIGREECARRLSSAAEDYESGRVWVLQRGETLHEDISYI
jgi:hypothetical protein